MNIKQEFKIFVLGVLSVFRSTIVATVCGHETKQSGSIMVDGKTSILSLPIDGDGHTSYCLDCIAKMSIRCVCCGETIYVGDTISLYEASLFADLPKHAVRYKYDNRYVIGCLRFDCCEMALALPISVIFTPALAPYTAEIIEQYRLRRSCA